MKNVCMCDSEKACAVPMPPPLLPSIPLTLLTLHCLVKSALHAGPLRQCYCNSLMTRDAISPQGPQASFLSITLTASILVNQGYKTRTEHLEMGMVCVFVCVVMLVAKRSLWMKWLSFLFSLFLVLDWTLIDPGGGVKREVCSISAETGL